MLKQLCAVARYSIVKKICQNLAIILDNKFYESKNNGIICSIVHTIFEFPHLEEILARV